MEATPTADVEIDQQPGCSTENDTSDEKPSDFEAVDPVDHDRTDAVSVSSDESHATMNGDNNPSSQLLIGSVSNCIKSCEGRSLLQC